MKRGTKHKRYGKKRPVTAAGSLSEPISYGVLDKRSLYALAFFLPLICMIIIYALMRVFPFGDKTALVMDLDGQYAQFFTYYHRVLTGGDSLFYSFSKEMGGNVFGLFAYYLSSPFFLIALLFPASAMPEGIALATILKIGCCGLSFAVFLRHVFHKSDFSVILFSCAYALMTYSMHYSMCIMWLDGAIWLPIILLGTERVINGRSGKLFIFSFTMSLISNYYTAYMNALAVVIYFINRYFTADILRSGKDLVAKTAKMLALAVICALISLVILLPTFADILNGKMSSASYVADGFWNIDIFHIFRRLFIGQYDSITNSGNPDIFCGMFAGVATGLFFTNPKIKLKIKISAFLSLAVLVTCFFIKRIDMVWHIFQYPNWYPYRYAYVFCCFALSAAFYGFSELKRENAVWALAGTGLYFSLILFAWIFRRGSFTNITLVKVSFVFAAVYILAVISLLYGKKQIYRYICPALVLITCGELTVNGYATLKGLNGEFKFKSRSEYSDFITDIGNVTKNIKERDNGLYRMEKTFLRTDNDSMTFGYNGTTHYSSTYNSNIVRFNNRMGMLQEYVVIRYMGSTMLTDSLLGVKYIVSDSVVNEDYDELENVNGYEIYENPYALPLCFAVNERSREIPSYTSSAADNQDKFAESLLGKSYIQKIRPVGKSDKSVTFIAPEDGIFYIDLKSKYERGIDLTVNGAPTDYIYDENAKKIFCLGKRTSGDKISAAVADPNLIDSAEIFMINSEDFEKDCLDLEKRALDITDFSNTKIKGSITLNSDEIIFTTIPYEKGWSAYIDGKKAETICAQDTFLAVPADAGEHTITLKYHVPWFRTSLAVSLLMLFGATAFYIRKSPTGKSVSDKIQALRSRNGNRR